MPLDRSKAVADFPQEGAQTPTLGLFSQFFDKKVHENERIWIPGASLVSPLDPPTQGELHLKAQIS